MGSKKHKPKKNKISAAEELIAQRGRFVRVAGEPVGFAIEHDKDPARIDHVWVSVRAGRFGLLRITLNTSSLRNDLLGLDPRVSIGIVESRWNHLPTAGVTVSEPRDYSAMGGSAVLFRPRDRVAFENLIAEKVELAVFVAAWGELYMRGHSGIHQVHSRAASVAFPNGQIGRDGSVQFYFDDGRAEMLLFKFYGQP